jgi:hypothetical protein
MILAIVPWLYAIWLTPKEWRPGLGVAYGAALLQIALWMLVVPGLALLTVSSAVHGPGRRRMLFQLLGGIEGGFGLFLIFALLIVGFAVGVWIHRWRWVRGYTGQYQTGYQPDIARLIVNVAIIGALIVLTASACGLSLASAVGRLPIDGFPMAWAGTLAALLFAPMLGLFRTGLRDALHVVTDIINHFYRRHDAFPRPWGIERKPVVRDFEIQQRIEARFRAVLKDVLADPEVTRLSVVSHSQGTIIAVDVFSRASMSPAYDAWLTDRLAQVGKLNLVTMGSPLTHLYQHYFPDRYASLSDGGWDGLKASLHSWANIYRIDDYIGTFVESPVAGVGDPNRPIHDGGHTEYWTQPAVFAAILQKEPGSLPG